MNEIEYRTAEELGAWDAEQVYSVVVDEGDPHGIGGESDATAVWVVPASDGRGWILGVDQPNDSRYYYYEDFGAAISDAREAADNLADSYESREILSPEDADRIRTEGRREVWRAIYRAIQRGLVRSLEMIVYNTPPSGGNGAARVRIYRCRTDPSRWRIRAQWGIYRGGFDWFGDPKYADLMFSDRDPDDPDFPRGWVLHPDRGLCYDRAPFCRITGVAAEREGSGHD